MKVGRDKAAHPQFIKGFVISLLLIGIGALLLNYLGYVSFSSEAGSLSPRKASTCASNYPTRDLTSSDIEAPAVTITSPSDGTVVSRAESKISYGQLGVRVNATASDNGAIVYTQYCVNDILDGVIVVQPPYEFIARLPNQLGTHTIKVVTFDRAGNPGEATITVNLVK